MARLSLLSEQVGGSRVMGSIGPHPSLQISLGDRSTVPRYGGGENFRKNKKH